MKVNKIKTENTRLDAAKASCETRNPFVENECAKISTGMEEI